MRDRGNDPNVWRQGVSDVSFLGGLFVIPSAASHKIARTSGRKFKSYAARTSSDKTILMHDNELENILIVPSVLHLIAKMACDWLARDTPYKTTFGIRSLSAVYWKKR